MQHLNHAWRAIGTAFFYLLFGVLGLINCFLVVPLLLLVVRDRQRLQWLVRAGIHRQFRFFIWLATGLRIIAVRFDGFEHRDATRGQLVLASHPTLIDVVLLLSELPQVECIVKEAVIRNPVLGAVARAANYISNRDPEQMLAEAESRLRAGHGLILFPEGTRSVAGKALKLKLGAAEIAVRAEAEILPVVIRCEPQILGKHQPWYYIPARKPEFTLQMLPPVAVGQILGAREEPRAPRYVVNDYLCSVFSESSA